MAKSNSIFADSFANVPDHLIKEINNELKSGLLLEQVSAAVNNARIAKQNYNLQRKSIEGVGQLKMSVDATTFHEQALLHGGYDIWRQKDFTDYLLKRHPEMKVKSMGTRLQVGYAPTNKRFSKTYNL